MSFSAPADGGAGSGRSSVGVLNPPPYERNAMGEIVLWSRPL